MLTAERWQRIEPILDAALDLSGAERVAFITVQCAGDGALAGEILQLIADMERPHAELDAPATELWTELREDGADDGHPLPTRLSDRYRIEAEIGRGGMAVVYRAFDERVQREVAIKVLRTDVAAAVSSERFHHEIRLTAMLRHANVVSLFDSGESDGFTYFVMPYIAGETLRDRLAAQGAQSLPEAVRIVRGILAALEHAHAAGVVHRDVKPSNVMLSGNDVLLADFGIARVRDAVDAELTEGGVVLGTPQYMSPEQSVGASDAGVASDIYSVGCVLYELLTGERSKRIASRTLISVTAVDATQQQARIAAMPSEIGTVVAKAMASDPLQRYASAAEFSLALVRAAEAAVPSSGAPSPARSRASWRQWPAGLVAAGVAAFGIFAYVRASAVETTAAGARVVGDTNVIELLPYEYDASARFRFGKPDQLRAALGRWTGVRLVDALRSDEIVAARGARPIGTADGSAIAWRLGAGRYIRRDVAERDGQIYVHAGLYDTGTGTLVAQANAEFGQAHLSDSAFRELADELLLAEVPLGFRTGAKVGTMSRPALISFATGLAAVNSWDLPAADSALARAASVDSAFALAELWLAQVRVWQERPKESWTYLLARAQTDTSALPARERRVLAALSAAGRGESARACTLWQQLAVDLVIDFSSWYGAALCELADATVVRDTRSASGWRFRSSKAHGVQSMLRAFDILPAVHREFRAQWFNGLAAKLATSPTLVRLGTAARPDTGLFFAYPSWDVRGDSLFYVPYRMSDFTRLATRTAPATLYLAVRHQREILLRATTGWRSAFPRSADVALAVAIALDKLGDASAVDTLAVARQLALDDEERLPIAIAQVWLMVKYGVPDDLTQLSTARRLADSLLRDTPVPSRALATPLASLALLTGQLDLAGSLVRRGSSLADQKGALVPLPVLEGAVTLHVLAAVGAQPDIQLVLERRISNAINLSVAPEQLGSVRMNLIGRAATMGFPFFRSAFIPEFAASGDPLASAELAWARADTARVRALLTTLEQNRRFSHPEDLKLETLLPEAELMRAMGDSRAAIARFDRTLNVISASDLARLQEPVGAATLARAIRVRAELATATGDSREAARWGKALRALWAGADSVLQPTVRAMTAMSGKSAK